MGYSDPSMNSVTYAFNEMVFTTSPVRHIIGPLGLKGKVRDVMVSVKTTMAGSSSTPRVQMGVTGDAARFSDLDLGTTAAPLAISQAQDDPEGLTDVGVDADTQLIMTIVAGVGTPAGLADVFVTVDWF